MLPFIGLMIILVPTLLLNLVFSQTAVIDLKLPEASLGGNDNKIAKEIEIVLREEAIIINYPQGILLKRIPVNEEGEYNYSLLTTVLQQIKLRLKENAIDKKNVTILSEKETPYQTMISVMDASRSFKAIVGVEVLDAELFPDIAFGDAPPADEASTQGVSQ